MATPYLLIFLNGGGVQRQGCPSDRLYTIAVGIDWGFGVRKFNTVEFVPRGVCRARRKVRLRIDQLEVSQTVRVEKRDFYGFLFCHGIPA